MRARLLAAMIASIAVSASCKGDDKSGVKAQFQDAKAKIARVQARQIAEQAYVQWQTEHHDEQCPTSLDELSVYLNAKRTVDPWGEPYIMLCGADAPKASASGFGVISTGPDKTRGTDDDIRSW